MVRVFLFSELGDRSPARLALSGSDWAVTPRVLRGTFIDCPIGLPPDLVVIEPAPLRTIEGLAAALAAHPVVARAPWIVVIDPERAHLASRLPCNDFVLRGFAHVELLARAARALGGRVRRDSAIHNSVVLNSVVHSRMVSLDLAANTARVSEVIIKLKPQEFALLRYLVQSQGRPLSRAQILSAVWGPDYDGGERTVDVHVRRLRAQLGSAASMLETLREVGYRWIS